MKDFFSKVKLFDKKKFHKQIRDPCTKRTRYIFGLVLLLL